LSISVSSVVRVLVAIALFLVLASTAGQLSGYLFQHGNVFGLVPLFFLDREDNIPTFFSTLLLLFSSVLLALIALLKRKEGYASHWAMLSFGFFFMSFDEAFEVHERLIIPVWDLLKDFNYNFLYFAWVVPGVALVVVLALVFRRFLGQLAVTTRVRFLIAGFVYLGGAIGVEMIGGRHAALYGHKNLTYSMIATVEESLEIAGLIIFIWALLEYFREYYSEVRFQIKS